MKVTFCNSEDKLLEEMDCLRVEKQIGFVPRYFIFIKNKHGFMIDYVCRQTMWGVNRYIKKMTKKKELYESRKQK